MTLQYSVAVRNAQLDAFEVTTGSGPTLLLSSGSAPANCAAADSGSLIATIQCPADWLEAAANGAKVIKGSWSVAASGAGVIGYFRIKDGSANCHCQGSVGIGIGDLQLQNTNVQAGQTITITTFTLTALGS